VVVPIPIVAIQVEQPPEASEWVAQMVTACTSGVSPNRCASADDPEAPKASHLAYVSWLDEAKQHALIEVGTPDKPRGHWRFQRLRFTTGDPPLDRWHAIGLTVATLVGTREPEPARKDLPPALAAQPVAVEEHAEQPHPFWLAVQGSLGTGFQGSHPAAGINLRVAYAVEAVPLFSTLTAGSRAASDGSVLGTWWDFGVGLGAYWQLSSVRASAAALVVAQSFRASVESSGGDEDSGTSATLGSGLLVELTWPSDGRVGFTLGGRGVWLRSPTEISVANQPAAESPQRSYTGFAGVEARF
jgi:hypothetical protein